MKNIVIFCDGTGNEVEGDLSNVLKLYRMAERNAEQVVFYDPGIGTIGNRNAWGRFKQDAAMVLGLVTGAGLDDNILRAYRFLANKYEPGDHIFLFGFSRGAYTVRALAGFVHLIGLLSPDQLNIAEYALRAYKRVNETHTLSDAWIFRNVVGTRRVLIHFVGVWDTVASILVPRADRFYIPSLQKLPYTRKNPSVRIFRHAMAIDERRRMFRLNHWQEPQPFISEPFAKPQVQAPQDIKQHWFAGVHSDVGGGFPETESAAAKVPLRWMADEAIAAGLQVSRTMHDHLIFGSDRPNGTHQYTPLDAAGPIHLGVRGAWKILEWIPKRTKWREWKRFSLLGLYLPRSEPRLIAEDATIDASVDIRRAEDSQYAPVNLPPR